MALQPGALREDGLEDGRLVLWMPAERDADYQYWQRVSTVPRAPASRQDGFVSFAATSIRARQRVRRGFSTVLQWFRRSSKDGSWLLPSGETAEQCGERQTDLLLVLADEQSQPLDAASVRARWPESTGVQSLGPGLFLLSGVTVPAAAREEDSESAEELCLKQAARSLTMARRKGDRADEAAALTDLGLAALEQGDLPRAIAHLEEALSLARLLEEPAREGDILGNLGLAMLMNKQPEQAQSHLEHALVLVRSQEDQFAEKLVLERLATVHVSRGDLRAALSLLDESLGAARAHGGILAGWPRAIARPGPPGPVSLPCDFDCQRQASDNDSTPRTSFSPVSMCAAWRRPGPI